MISYNIMKILSFLMKKRSFKFVEKVGLFLGKLMWLLGWRREEVKKHLGWIFPQESSAWRDRMARSVYSQWGQTLSEFIRGDFKDFSVKFDNKEILENIIKKGEGAYVLCFHMGNWEIMGHAVRQMVPVHTIVRTLSPPGLNRWLIERRMKEGFFPIQRKKKGDVFQKIQEVFSLGHLVGFVLDHARGTDKIPFLNLPARTNTSLAAFWLRRPAPVLPMYTFREGPGVHRVVVLPPWEPSPLAESLSENEKIIEYTKDFNNIIGSCVLQKPDQYFWFHKRWEGAFHGSLQEESSRG